MSRADRVGPPGEFSAPGPGSWTLDTLHFPRPVTAFVRELFPDAAQEGFEAATRRYGLLLDHIRWGFSRRWAYLSPRPVGPLRRGMPRSREAFEQLVGAEPRLADRLAVSARVFEERRWRGDVRRWDEQTKPALGRQHRALAAVDPRELDDRRLCAHVERCRTNLRRAVVQHHRLNVAPVLPTGDFLVHAREWSGRPAAELLQLIGGQDPRAGAAAAETARLVGALRDDVAAGELLEGDDAPEVVLERLVGWPGPPGRAATAYLDTVGHLSTGRGADITEPRLVERPGMLVDNLRAALHAPGAGGGDGPAAELAAAVRAEVPAGRRGDFDGLLAEARATHRVRDERALFCEVWACGLARRAVLAAGERLAGTGVVERPDHLLEAGRDELRALVRSGSGPSAAELARRSRYRREADEKAAPDLLGDPVGSPVPAGWLPAGAARTERAFRTYVAAMSGGGPGDGGAPDGGDARTGPLVLRGRAASPGAYTGVARVVADPADLGRVEAGDVLVTGAATPAFQAVLSRTGAVVTDLGGQLCHAAIVAREFGIPAVVGTGQATRSIPDGARVSVDGASGVVRVEDG